MLLSITHSWIGQLHLLVSVVSLVLGSLILWMRKGSLLHKRIGYAYALAMLLVNLTAFGIYRLFNGFGPFHGAALISLFSLAAGMLPIYFKDRMAGWYHLHISFMYYSVIGLYAAFLSEIVTRIPGLHFGMMVGLGTGLVMLVGVVAFQLKRKFWLAHFK